MGRSDSEVAAFHIARQAIVDDQMRVNAYELFFRTISETRSPFDPKNADFASAMVMLGGFVDGGEFDILDNKPAFVNISQELAESGLVTGMCRKDIIFEVTIEKFSDQLVTALQQMAKDGYRFALDRFQLNEAHQLRILEHCDYIKCDMRGQLESYFSQLIQAIANYEHVQAIATCVETREDFEHARKLGFAYFQGYFFCRPLIVQRSEIVGSKLEIMRAVSEAFRPDVEIKELAEVLRRDATLTYRLLRVVNSSFYFRGQKIEGVYRALQALGVDAARRWLTLLSLSKIQDKPKELLAMAMIRANFCDRLSAESGEGSPTQAFLCGLLSLLDTIMDQPMSTLLERISVADEIADGILAHGGIYGKILDCAVAQERGDWFQVHLGKLDRLSIQQLYLESIRWARQIGALCES